MMLTHHSDYFKGGAMVDHSFLPSATQIEAFYKKQLFSIIINSQWRKRKIWTTFHATNDTSDASGPNQTRYYSPTDGGVYYTYAYHESGILKGFLEAPTGLDHLNESTWDISGTDISKSSAASFRTARFNFTEPMAHDALASAVASNGTSSPWADGAGWVGTWTLPVCVLPPDYNWNTQYADTSSRYGMLPCCCGEKCKDTKDFVAAANLVGFQTLLYACEAQLRGTEIEFASVDYGFGKKTGPAALPYFWATLGTGKKAGLAIGMVVGGLVVLVLLFVCVGSCCASCFS
ncbi:uncharacterized protein CC84DRAFT_414624 [Paraphaeosphaeria sporulosa]|uniref:Uncharacterized protein n=1 Tax=Paraphaeosphaeria sporulosa TaxID=1460663 RepID=A0A177BXB5_9PLEO|nr:uncharacterized protein CC84DRAFT_414624 [Paraphaeosphaeria sporulosa]OAF99026.1 hypothetical protein CC84DRAFT_414624 [Paraphaeosphaeria sporulosa]